MSSLALCIPAYNAEAYLPRLLQSAKDQLIPFDEVWLYNDCSTDDTANIALSYGAKVITGDVNRGCSYGKNALAEATGCEWIHFHDADDELLPEFTTLANKWINKANQPDVVLFDYEYRDNATNELIGIRMFDKEKLETDPVAYAILEQINPFCGLYSKAKFIEAGGYDTDQLVLYNEDTAFHIKMAIYGLTFSAENKVAIVNYRIGNSMSSSNYNKCLEAQFHVLNKTAGKVAEKYAYQIATRLWQVIGPAASVGNWDYVKKILKLSSKLGYNRPPVAHGLFRSLTMLNPFLGVWLREQMIRLFKPGLRRKYGF